MALSNPAVSDTINITVPSAVADRIDVYRLECADEGGQIELDGDEISVWRQRLWVQLAAFDKREFLAHRNHWGVEDETNKFDQSKILCG